MKYILKLILIILFFCEALFSQQLPLFSEYNYNGHLLNPAMTGWEGINAVSLGYRHQWTSIKTAPRTTNLAYIHHEDTLNMSFGGCFVNDQTGPTSFSGLMLNYAYHIPFSGEKSGKNFRNRLSMGVSLSGLSYRLNGIDLKYPDLDDPLIIKNNQTQFLPDAGMGVFYVNDLYYFGFSVPQLISLNVKFDDDLALSSIRRIAHLYMQAGAKIRLHDPNNIKWKQMHFVVPTLWVKFAPTSPMNVNFNVRYLYSDFLAASLGFGSDGTMIIDFMLNIKKNYRFGYAFSTSLNKLSPVLGTNHEIMLSYIFKSIGKGWFVQKINPIKITFKEFKPKVPKTPKNGPTEPVKGPPKTFRITP
jgi:type IX secretion system PorP/SprF family membrane protein